MEYNFYMELENLIGENFKNAFNEETLIRDFINYHFGTFEYLEHSKTCYGTKEVQFKLWDFKHEELYDGYFVKTEDTNLLTITPVTQHKSTDNLFCLNINTKHERIDFQRTLDGIFISEKVSFGKKGIEINTNFYDALALPFALKKKKKKELDTTFFAHAEEEFEKLGIDSDYHVKTVGKKVISDNNPPFNQEGKAVINMKTQTGYKIVIPSTIGNNSLLATHLHAIDEEGIISKLKTLGANKTLKK